LDEAPFDPTLILAIAVGLLLCCCCGLCICFFRKREDQPKKERRGGMWYGERHAVDPTSSDGGAAAPEGSLPAALGKLRSLARHASSIVVGAERSYGTLVDEVRAAEPSSIEMDRRFSSVPTGSILASAHSAKPRPPPRLSPTPAAEVEEGWTEVGDGQWRRASAVAGDERVQRTLERVRLSTGGRPCAGRPSGDEAAAQLELPTADSECGASASSASLPEMRI